MTTPATARPPLELPTFSGSLQDASASDAWLNGCVDAFDLYESLYRTTLTVTQRILAAGVQFMQINADAAAWWNENRDELKKLTSWDAFATRVRDKFIPTNWRLDALSVLHNILQGTTPFPEYIQSMTRGRSALASAGDGYKIDDNMFKHLILFHAQLSLQLCVRAQPGFDFAKITVDELTSIMATCWELVAKQSASSWPMTLATQVSLRPRPLYLVTCLHHCGYLIGKAVSNYVPAISPSLHRVRMHAIYPRTRALNPLHLFPHLADPCMQNLNLLPP